MNTAVTVADKAAATLAPVSPTEPARAISAFSSEDSLRAGYRIAKAIASSSLVPEAYRGEANIPNVMIALELANRIGCSVLMCMQNLDLIHGRPSWRAQFLIATANASGKFTPLRFRYEGKEFADDWGCRVVAKDIATGEECVGPLVTMGMAKAEGWYAKNGSKWKSLPTLMASYRAAAFWVRLYAPELSLGMQTAEEVIDTVGYAIPDGPGIPAAIAPGDAKALEAALLQPDPVPVPDPIPVNAAHDADGVVT